MASPSTSIRNIGTSNPMGISTAPPVNMNMPDSAYNVNGYFDKKHIPPKYANYTFGAGVIVFVVFFSGIWILLVSFTPNMILVNDPNNSGVKTISYGITIMWSFLIALVLMALSSASLWFSL